MDLLSKSTVTAFAGPSSEVTSPPAYDEDGKHGHFAAIASAAAKASGSMPPVAGPSQWPETTIKEGKSTGARVHEDCRDADLPSPTLRSSRLFKGTGKDAIAVEREKRKPLCLLDLPVDVLKDIVKEVTHTNDLTSLALCHSALHQLVIPHIYSRFDIVWPESNTQNERRSGVDALTYGLATLVMAEEIFGEAPSQRREHSNRFNASGRGPATENAIRRRRGNHYAQFTKKFSLGNGPSDWVQEYLITKEGGKMLGTLVALSVARMRSLETFAWDMPTGILRDIWLALSSLGDREDTKPCRLEKVWVRLHDNTSTESTSIVPPPPPPPPPPPQINLATMPPPLSTSGAIAPVSYLHHPTLLDRVEHPSFSILPPLKSLSVLDIDELAYLDEMAVLIEKSLDKLRELRVGIARHAMTRDFVTVWEGDTLQQVDSDHPTAGSITIGEKRLGGVLGTLTGFVQDMRKPRIVPQERSHRRRRSSRNQACNAVMDSTPQHVSTSMGITAAAETSGPSTLHDVIPELPGNELGSSHGFRPSIPISECTNFNSDVPAGADPAITNALSAVTSLEPSIFVSPEGIEERIEVIEEKFEVVDERAESPESLDCQQHYLDNVLQLESLELERVPLSVPVLSNALDWTRLTSLTLLNCPNHEQLWKTLRRKFAPTPRMPTHLSSRRATISTHKEFEYPLKLKKIHTNTVSPALISFTKETLAPNSLETLFLQEARSYSSTVQVDTIFRGPLRRHRKSLKKLLIDSSEKGSDGQPINSSRWRMWMLTPEVLNFVCSGKMPSLRELGMAIDYGSWHFFLQHLPQIPHLRSLYLPFLGNHVHGVNIDAKELALQLVDIVALRPEVELCYIGIARQCFEILENNKGYDPRDDLVSTGPVDPEMPPEGEDGDDDEDDVEEDEEDDEDEDDEQEDEDEEANDTESDVNDADNDDDDDDDDETDSETDGFQGSLEGTKGFRQREILFYDDKVAIFKARHGKL